MKVKDLIKLLQEQPSENDVMLYDYNSEDGGIARVVRTESREDENSQSYFKGDHPYSYNNKLSDELTVIESR